MIAKNIKGKSFEGCVRYVMNATSKLLEAEGVLADSTESIIRCFEMQQSQRSEIKQPVGHIPIAFSPEDKAKMTDEFMLKLAKEYMNEMGIGNTQYIIVRHRNTDHDHLHIVYNRIDNDLKLISVNNDYKRNIAVCKKLKERYGLTFGKGKEAVNRPKLHGADKAKYEIYDAMKLVIPKSHNLRELSENLHRHGITLYMKHRRGSDIIVGISLEKDGYKFKASEIDRRFSHAGLQKLFVALKYIEEKRKDESKAERKANPPTPTIKGVKLTTEQWETIKSGSYLYINNFQTSEGKRFSSYIFTDDKHKRIFFSKIQPDTFVKHGKYEMREMDRRLIEAGCVTRDTVKWWGGDGQLARPYLWKANSTDTEYRESWSDPRTPSELQSQQAESSAPHIEKSGSPIYEGTESVAGTAAEAAKSILNTPSEAAKSVTDTAADIASTLGGIFDISTDPSSAETAEEAEFRRRMQQKKKRGIRR